MKGLSVLAALGLLVFACANGTTSSTTPPPTSLPPPTFQTIPTTTGASTTTTSRGVTALLDPSALPLSGECAIDAAPQDGEATVLVTGRLYGLGADSVTPRCLVDTVASADIEWGPQGDRVRIGSSVMGSGVTVTKLRELQGWEWTAPTGSRMVEISRERLIKVSLDGSGTTDISFLEVTDDVAYHPAGTHLLAVGKRDDQHGLWFATNQGNDPILLAADSDATLSSPAWLWTNEPVFIADHGDVWHLHRFEVVDGVFEGPVIVEGILPMDRLFPSPFDPVLIAYRLGADEPSICVEGAFAAVNGLDLPEELAGLTSTPVGWLSDERLLVLSYPDGCDSPADLWSFSAGFCPGSVYGAELLISGVVGAAARQARPTAPPSPDFGSLIEPAPA